MEQGLQLFAFTELLSQLPGLHWWQSRDGDAYAFAPACSNLVESPEPITPQAWQELLHPHDRQRRKKVYLQLPLNQEATVEYRLLTTSGYQWVQENVRLVQSDGAGAVLLSTATTCQEPAYRAMLNNISLFVVLIDPEGNIQELNSTSEPFLVQQREQVWGLPIWNSPCFQHPSPDSNQIKEVIQKAAAGEHVGLQEWTLTYNGIQFHGNFSIRPIYNRLGYLEYLVLEGADISHQKRIDQQWRSLAENIPDIIIRFDRELRYLFANAAIESFTGKKPEHFLGRSVQETSFPDPGWDGFEHCLMEALRTRSMKTYSGEVTSPQLSKHYVYSLIVPELDEKGEVASLLVITRDISELAQKEDALEQTNAKLRAIIEGTRDIICAFDTDYRLIAFNAAYEEEVHRIFGARVRLKLTLDEMLADYPAELKNAKDLWKRAIQGEEYSILQEFGDPGRERNYYEINFSSIRGEAGQIIGASSRVHNVSRKRQIEKELKDAHEFLVLAENLPQIIFTARPNGQIDYLNQAFFEYTNQPAIPAEQADWKKALHPEDYRNTIQQWLEAVKHKAPGLQLELRLRNRHGLYRWHIARAVPILNSLHKPIKWVGVMSDVHEAKVAGERERLAANEFKTISESLPHIVWTTRADGGATYFNNKWYDYTGEDEVVINEWNWTKFLHDEDKARTKKAWDKSIATGTHYQVEYRLRHKTGRYRWFLARGVPVTDTAGRVSKWFGTCTDIHENKLQRKRLQTQNDRLQQMNQYLDNFVHAAAHDLRSPVANMKGLLHLLRASGAVNASSTANDSKVVESMETSLYRLDNTLQAMIHSIELQSLKQSPAKALNLQEMFDQVLLDFSDRLRGIPHEIHKQFDNCPDLMFIPFYLESLFRNLLSNSIKYRKEEGILHIHVSCRTYRSYKLLEFSDNGIGIDLEKYKTKLFRPFQRFTQQAGGKGIGLHLINNIVTKTGGKIEVKSSPGNGATFLMYLKDLEV